VGVTVIDILGSGFLGEYWSRWYTSNGTSTV